MKQSNKIEAEFFHELQSSMYSILLKIYALSWDNLHFLSNFTFVEG